MGDFKKRLVDELKRKLNFKKDLRTALDTEIYPPDDEEFETEDQIQELENRDQYGIPRW